jgi:hypothetical protein
VLANSTHARIGRAGIAVVAIRWYTACNSHQVEVGIETDERSIHHAFAVHAISIPVF